MNNKFVSNSSNIKKVILLVSAIGTPSYSSSTSIEPALIAKEIIDETSYLQSSRLNAKRINNALKNDSGSTTYKSLEELKRVYKS